MTLPPLAWALIVSAALNAGLGWAWLHERDEAAKAGIQRDNAQSAASACSDATEALRDLADQRKAEADQLRQAASKRATGHEQRAQKTLSTGPSVPADQCASIRDLGRDWLRERAVK